MHARRLCALLAALAVSAVAGATALAQGTPEEAGIPVLSHDVARGGYERVALESQAPVASRTVDGSFGDWAGAATRFGGTTVADRGELIYQDFLFDSWGADGGRDADRMELQDQFEAALPEAYRVDALQQADAPSQIGVAETPEQLRADVHYGDGPRIDSADLFELRLAADANDLWVLARTSTMTDPGQTGLLLLLDTTEGGQARAVGFGTGLETSKAELALLLRGDSGKLADLASGTVTDLPAGSVATNPAGYDNAIEARIPRALIGSSALEVAAGTGASDGNSVTIANAAFRDDEPVREYFDKRQALALHAKTIDPFFESADLDALAGGQTERFVPGPGYHERQFTSSGAISNESGQNGIRQRYGLYLPEAYGAGTPTPVQYWLHFRGGEAHTAATLVPRVFQHYGEDRDTVVVSPHARGSSSWYVGKGQVDFQEVWADVLDTVSVDRDRVYVSGHSMGGFGTYLLTTLFPDRFAAGMPVAGPVTQGAWTGADFEGCDDYTYDDYSPCYIQANGGDARTQHTRKLLENLRHVPLALFHGTDDELVPVSGVTRQAERIAELGYRFRYYLFPGYEHFSHPVVDEWAAGARYMHTFRRDPNPAHVTYIRDMPFERATETSRSDGVALDFSFDSAYWMSDLEAADATNGQARFDGRSLALAERPVLTVPEAGGPSEIGTTGPFAMVGLQQLDDPITPAAQTKNEFEITLSGARAVTLDLDRMGIESGATGRVESDHPLALTLNGPGGTQTFDLPAGRSQVTTG